MRERAKGREKRIKEKLTGKAKQLKSLNLVFKSFPVSLLLRDMTVKESEFFYFQPTRVYVHIYTHPQHRHTNVQRGGGEKIILKKMLKLCQKNKMQKEFFLRKSIL